jgi:hypothetical protein
MSFCQVPRGLISSPHVTAQTGWLLCHAIAARCTRYSGADLAVPRDSHAAVECAQRPESGKLKLAGGSLTALSRADRIQSVERVWIPRDGTCGQLNTVGRAHQGALHVDMSSLRLPRPCIDRRNFELGRWVRQNGLPSGHYEFQNRPI